MSLNRYGTFQIIETGEMLLLNYDGVLRSYSGIAFGWIEKKIGHLDQLKMAIGLIPAMYYYRVQHIWNMPKLDNEYTLPGSDFLLISIYTIRPLDIR